MRGWLLSSALLLGACAGQPVVQVPDERDSACAALFADVEQTIRDAGVVDHQDHRVDGFAYLRLNRYLASHRDAVADGATFEAWIDRMQRLALDGWSFELANLPTAERQRLAATADTGATGSTSLDEALRACSAELRRDDFAERAGYRDLVAAAEVPDDYQAWKRVVGLYEISGRFFLEGIGNWHDEARTVFATPLDRLAVEGSLKRYAPARGMLPPREIARLLAEIPSDPLGIPEPAPAVVERLFEQFAPVFEIDTVTDDDRIGRILLKDGMPVVDTNRPTVYRYLSRTRVGDQALLQLNYLAWFPSRPKTSSLDLLGGHLDGLVWRVTLLPDGRPWLFDSIHPCGCYHMVFPTRYATVSPQQDTTREPLLVGPTVTVDTAVRVHIRISSGSHYIERVYFPDAARPGAVGYTLADHDELRSLPTGDAGRRSLYRDDGIVPSSRRGERFVFWPMGIASPGAMRQPGNQATAFVGRRHFDDARLFEPFFGFGPGVH